jgi:hypothetical protein
VISRDIFNIYISVLSPQCFSLSIASPMPLPAARIACNSRRHGSVDVLKEVSMKPLILLNCPHWYWLRSSTLETTVHAAMRPKDRKILYLQLACPALRTGNPATSTPRTGVLESGPDEILVGKQFRDPQGLQFGK